MFQPKTPSLPQINVNEFNPAAVLNAIIEYGSYELVGPSIDEISPYAYAAMEEQMRALNLPAEELAKYDNRGEFNGYQNIKVNTENQVAQGKSNVVRNADALHYNPRKPDKVKIPDGIAKDAFDNYYHAARNLLIKHVRDIERAFVHESLWSDFSTENNSVLMMRRYFPTYEPSKTATGIATSQATTGIPCHSDHGEASLVTSNVPGLEVYRDPQWVLEDPAQGKQRFLINIGDVLLCKLIESHKLDPVRFPLYNFQAGLHRVSQVNELRYSLTVSLNPADDALVYTPKAGPVKFSKFLQTPKSLYRDTSRDESASAMGKLVDLTRPRQPHPLPFKLPTLYVAESGKNGQDSWVMVNGSDMQLSDQDNEDIPAKAREFFSFAYKSLEEAQHAARDKVYLRVFEVSPLYGNDIYVIDASASNPAATISPLCAATEKFKKPIYLIQRPMLVDEATEVRQLSLDLKK